MGTNKIAAHQVSFTPVLYFVTIPSLSIKFSEHQTQKHILIQLLF
jgi:hypothetical protein